MTTNDEERPFEDEQFPSEPESGDQRANAYCADCGYELPYSCAHCGAREDYEREQAQEAAYRSL